MSVFCLGSDQIAALWPKFGRHIERLERETGLALASEIRAKLETADFQLWGWQEADDITGVAVTSVIKTPQGPCCWIVGACGTESRKGQIDAIIATIEAWAKGIGCSRVMLRGRKGWLRRLSNYRQVEIVLQKDL